MLHPADSAASQPDRTVGAVIGLVLVLIGASMFQFLPLITAGADKLDFSAGQVGVMSSLLTATSGIGSLLDSMGLSLLLALAAHRFWLYASLQGAAALFSSTAFSLGMTVISDGVDSARRFGAAMAAVQAAYQIGALWAGPTLLRLPAVSGVLVLLAILAGLAMTLVPLLPARGRPRPLSPRGGLLRPAVLLTFLGPGLFFVGAGAYWTYIELLGQARGMSSQLVADWIAVSVAAGASLAALLVSPNDYGAVIWIAALAACLSVGMYGLSALLHAPAPGAEDQMLRGINGGGA